MGRNCGLHPLIHTSLEFTLAQDVELQTYQQGGNETSARIVFEVREVKSVVDDLWGYGNDKIYSTASRATARESPISRIISSSVYSESLVIRCMT